MIQVALLLTMSGQDVKKAQLEWLTPMVVVQKSQQTTNLDLEAFYILSLGRAKAVIQKKQQTTYKPEPAVRNDPKQFTLNFSNVDVATIIRVLGQTTKDNIVYASEKENPISVNFRATSTEEALRYIASIANLKYKQVGKTFVVAPSASIRQAIEPFGNQERVAVTQMTPVEAVAFLTEANPFVTAKVSADQVTVTGPQDDLDDAIHLLREREATLERLNKRTSEVVLYRYVSAQQVNQVLTRTFGDPSQQSASGGSANPNPSAANQTRTLDPNDFTFTTISFQTGQQSSGGTGSSGSSGSGGGGSGGSGGSQQGGATGGGQQGASGGQSSLLIQLGGSVILTGKMKHVEEAKQIIALIDRPTTQDGGAQYQIYSVKYSSAQMLVQALNDAFKFELATIGPSTFSPENAKFNPLNGSTLGGGTSSSGGTGTAGGSAGPGAAGSNGPSLAQMQNATTLILRGSQDTINAATKLLDQLDVEPQQVEVAVQVLDTSPEKVQELGVNWSWSPFQFLEAKPGTGIDGTTGAQTSPVTGALPFGMFSRTPFSVQGILRAMVTEKEAKLLANPNVTVTNNEDANIFIGETLRAKISQGTGLGTQTVQVVEFPVGIVLLIKPRVNADGNITLRIHPVVSTVTGINSDNLPQTSSREAETTVMVKDGDTVAIGGLIREEMSRTMSQIPILSQLPLVGQLFRSRSSTGRRSEILIFITTKIRKSATKK